MKGEIRQVNKQSGRIGLYLVLIVALIAGYLYLNNQVAVPRVIILMDSLSRQ